MRRRSADATADRRQKTALILLAAFVTCSLLYTSISIILRRSSPISSSSSSSIVDISAKENATDCCRGVENLELWGAVAKSGSDFRLKSSKECCEACKKMCAAGGGESSCGCNSWVFCGDRENCGEKFGQCWLKKQNDPMVPDVSGTGKHVVWTSGVIFGRGEGIVSLETSHGTIRIKLFSDCAPHSVNYIFELLRMRHCGGCHFYRAESRGLSWNEQGDHIPNMPLGPPYGLIQGTLAVDGLPFHDLPKESCPPLQRGMVAWVGSGPEFFISLANHVEWRRAFTVFGSVLPEDMAVAESLAELPTKPDKWNGVNVRVLEEPVPLKVKTWKKG